MVGHQPLCLRRRGDDLQRVETVEFIPRLKLDDLCIRQRPPRAVAEPFGAEAVGSSQARSAVDLRRRVLHPVVPVHHLLDKGHIVDEVFTGRVGLENQVAELAVDRQRQPVGNALAARHRLPQRSSFPESYRGAARGCRHSHCVGLRRHLDRARWLPSPAGQGDLATPQETSWASSADEKPRLIQNTNHVRSVAMETSPKYSSRSAICPLTHCLKNLYCPPVSGCIPVSARLIFG